MNRTATYTFAICAIFTAGPACGPSVPKTLVDDWDPWFVCEAHPCVTTYGENLDTAIECCVNTEGLTSASEVTGDVPANPSIITGRAAVCTSQAQGFSVSDQACTAELRYGYSDIHFWDVRAAVAYECDDGLGHYTEERVFIDAVSGEYFRRGEQIYELTDCE